MCIVNFNEEGKVKSVNTVSGESSILFDKIASNPLIKSQEDALSVYKNVYAPKFLEENGDWQTTEGVNQYETKEPRLFYKDAFGEVSESFGEALKSSQGGSVQMGFVITDDIVETSNSDSFFKNDLVKTSDSFILNNQEAFMPVVTFENTNVDVKTKDGFILYGIKRGILSDSMKKVGDTYFLKGQGNQQSLSDFNSELVRAEAIKKLGTTSVKVFRDGTLEINPPTKDFELISTQGTSNMKFEEMQERLENKEFDTLDKKYDNMVGIAYNVFRQTQSLFTRSKPTDNSKTEGDLKVILLNSLAKLGISTLSISEYVEKYKQKNGVDPDVDALADIANNVIAFAEGQDTVENLSEETAHFIIEGYEDQDSINAILDQVVGTQEWNQYSQLYYDKYSSSHTGEQLDKIVKREILGKILANKMLLKDTATPTTLVNTLQDILNRFLNKVRAFFNLEIKQSIDSVLNDIASKVVNKEIENYIDVNLLKNSEFVMYSLKDRQVLLTLAKGRKRLESQLTALKSAKDASSGSIKQKVNQITAALAKQDEWHATKVLISALDPQVKSITRQLAHYATLSANNKNKDVAYFTPEEQHAFKALSKDYLPILEDLKAIIKEDQNPPQGINVKQTVGQIDTLISQISDLRGQVTVQSRKDKTAIYNRIASQYGLNPAQQDRLEKYIEDEFKDISMFQSFFGSLEHASNPILGMLGRIINQNNHRANTNTLRDINAFRKKVQNEGWDIKKFNSILETDTEGNITGFTQSPYLWEKFHREEKEAQVAAFNKVFGKSLTVKEYDKALKDKTIPRRGDYTIEETSDFDGIMAEWYQENTERKYTQEYYDEKEKLYKTLGISDSTVEFMRNISIARYTLLAPYLKTGKQLDYQKDVPLRVREQLAELVQQRKAAKSVVDAETGEFKTGNPLELAEDLQKLDEHFKNNPNVFQTKDTFFDTLEEVEKTEGYAAAFEWLKANGGLTFSQKFWDSFASNVKLVDRLKSLDQSIRSESTKDADDLIAIRTKMEELMLRKTSILKQYQTPNNPSEINADNMSSNALVNIKAIETELQETFNSMNTILREYEETEAVNPNIATENTTNEAYDKALADSGMTELEFIKQHTTDKDKVAIDKTNSNLNDIEKGSNYVSKSLQSFMEKAYDLDNPSADEIRTILNQSGVENVSIAYAKTRLLPYFKRFAPEGYSSFLNDLKTGGRSVTEFVKKSRDIQNGKTVSAEQIETLVQVSPQFAWTEDSVNQKYENPNYRDNFEGGMRQPLLNKYMNDGFFNTYGINKQNYLRTGQLNGTNNLQNLAMLQDLWAIKEKGLNLYKEDANQNVYALPQVSKKLVEKTKDFFTKAPGKTISNTIKDLIYNRVDDLGYGERIGEQDVRDLSDMRLIPKYYVRPLEEKSDISTELAYSYTMFIQSAHTYDQRQNTVSDAMVLEQGLLDTMNTGGKQMSDTNAYKMFKNFMDSYFFGIKNTRKFEAVLPNGKRIDVTKLATAFDQMVRYVNIGFSIPVAATSFVTAKIFLNIENYIGEHTNKHSASWASKEFRKLSPKFFSEIGNINRENKLFKLGERFRIFDLADSVTSSGFNRIIRASNQLPYKFSEVANFPIVPKIMLTVLDDFRLVEGKFVDFNNFKTKPENVNKEESTVLEEWETHRENSMYNLLETGADGVIDFNQNTKATIDNDYLETQLSRAQNRIRSVNANVDSIVPQEDKSAATRDFLLNFTMAHRGWITIAIQRRFKKAHFNFATGQEEEGHYRTLSKYLKKVYGGMTEAGMKNLVETIKQEYDGLEDFEKRNVKRIMVELGVYMSMLALGILVAAASDDDDNTDVWAIQFMAYIYFRSVNELGSSQMPTAVFSALDVIESPVMASNSIKEILDVKGWSLEEVNSGAYAGHSKVYRKLAKQTWLKHWYQMNGIKKISDFYRLQNIHTLITMQKEKKEE